jgi:CRP-like cAMP-binding protein
MMKDRIWYLQKCDLLSTLDTEQLRSIERRSQVKRFSAGSPVYLPSQSADSVMLVAQGLVKICHLTDDGKAATLALIATGEMFGELALLDHEQRGEYCEAIDPTTIVRIPRETLKALMRRDLEVTLRITKMVGLRRQRVERRLRNLLFTPTQERLTHLLLDLAEQFGVVGDDGIRLRLRLSHQEIANLIGATRETVTIMLGKLKRAGLVGGRRQAVVIKDVARLASTVGRQWQATG